MTPSDQGILSVLVLGITCVSASFYFWGLERKWEKERSDGINNIRRNDLRHNRGIPASVSTNTEKEE
jgi:hypothetical protein